MKLLLPGLLLAFLCSLQLGADAVQPPKAGKVEILPLDQVKPGMKATAWTVFAGLEPEPVPVEIVGRMRNASGPGQDIILARMGGKALHTGVAAGMSGSPVYYEGKLIGAVALRFGLLAKDPMCGITPIEQMLEINEFDASRPSTSRAPGDGVGSKMSRVDTELGRLTPIDTPLTFSGFAGETMELLRPMLATLGVAPVAGGSTTTAITSAQPVKGWEKSLAPGSAVSAILVSGDLNIAATGTVSYNDGRRVLAFGHPFFNLGPVSMPIAQSEVLTILADSAQPSKVANAIDVVGALRQDRHSGILGELGQAAQMIPVALTVRTLNEAGAVTKKRELHYNVFIQQKWTPFLMMATLYNSVAQLNDYAEESTYRFSGEVMLDGERKLSLSTMLSPSEAPTPASVALASWWGDKFNRLFANQVAVPGLRAVNATLDLLPERRVAVIESAYAQVNDVLPGAELPVKVFLRPYRGERQERDFMVKIPAGLPRGELRVLLSDADTLNRMQAVAGQSNRFLGLTQTVSLLNQERVNTNLYASIVRAQPTFYYEDKSLPSLPASALNVMQSGRTANRPLASFPETAEQRAVIPFDQVISGSYVLRVNVL